MPCHYRIFPRRGLVIVHYSGVATAADGAEAFGAYMQDPEFAPGQKQYVDLSAVTSFEMSFGPLLELQARKAGAFLGHGAQTLLAYYAPTRISFDMARIVQRSWEGISSVVPRVFQDEAEALSFLGQPEQSIPDLMARA